MSAIPPTQGIELSPIIRAILDDGKLAERWARVDFEDIKRQLTSPIR